MSSSYTPEPGHKSTSILSSSLDVCVASVSFFSGSFTSESLVGEEITWDLKLNDQIHINQLFE